MDAEIDKVHFEYRRIPMTWEFDVPCKGRPASKHLFPYVRGDGFLNNNDIKIPPLSKGGKVVCTITAKDEEQYIGEAYCSCSENFCYKMGRDISLGRAKKQMEVCCE